MAAGHFIGLPVRMIQAGADSFLITSPFRFRPFHGADITVPVLRRGDELLGFLTDGGTKPRLVMWLIGTHTDRYFPAYVVHDAGYVLKTHGTNGAARAAVDGALLEAMETIDQDDPPATKAERAARALKRATIYRVVRLFGALWYHAGHPVDLATITPATPGKHFALIPPDTSLPSARILTLALPKTNQGQPPAQ